MTNGSNGTTGNGNGHGNGNGNGTPEHEFQMSVEREPFGETAYDQPVDRFILTNQNGLKVGLITFGAVVTSVDVPDANGDIGNVTLGFETLREYEENAPYFGAICGRYANRIANGKFSIDDEEFILVTNNGPNHLHGGPRGFHQVVWNARKVDDDQNSVGVELSYTSRDGEEGYPGTLKATVVYTLNSENEFKIDYTATCDKPTPVNLTSHCYWNLAGDGDVLEHRLLLDCDQFLPVDATQIPTGELADVSGTAMDFTTSTAIGSRIEQVEGGYDHCWVVNGEAEALRPAARVEDPQSGRVMEVFTTEPGLQFYTGNFLNGSSSSGGFEKHQGFCLECQRFPNSPNQADFPNSILRPGEVYRQQTVYKFSTLKP